MNSSCSPGRVASQCIIAIIDKGHKDISDDDITTERWYRTHGPGDWKTLCWFVVGRKNEFSDEQVARGEHCIDFIEGALSVTLNYLVIALFMLLAIALSYCSPRQLVSRVEPRF